MADLLDDLKAIGDVSAVLLKAANEIRGLRAAAREKDINLCFERAVRKTAEHQLAQANAKIEGLERANRGLRHRVEELEGRPEWDSEGAAAKGGEHD